MNVGVIAVETRLVEQRIPADPGNPESREVGTLLNCIEEQKRTEQNGVELNRSEGNIAASVMPSSSTMTIQLLQHPIVPILNDVTLHCTIHTTPTGYPATGRPGVVSG